MNKITKYFNDISDDIFHEAVSNRRTYNLNKKKYTYEMQAIRLRNGSDKEKESNEKSNISNLIVDILSDNSEFVPEIATTAAISEKFSLFKKFIKSAGQQSTKLSNNLGVRQFKLGLLLYIGQNIQKYQPALYDPKKYSVKPSTNPNEKCLEAIDRFRSLDIATLIENENDEI